MYHSKIDHFVSNLTVYNAITEASVIHCGSNLSDHSPINCKMKVGELNISLEDEVKRKVPSWNKASTTQQNDCIQSINSRLENIQIPDTVNCQEVHCNHPHHKEELETYSMSVLEALDTAAWVSLPTIGVNNNNNNNNNAVNGWNLYVKSYQTESNFGGSSPFRRVS